MNSAELVNDGFVHWQPFHPANEQAIRASTPEKPGVFVIRRRQVYHRLTGQSDIVYIGSATGQRGLNNRLGQIFHLGRDQPTNPRLLALLEKSTDYEVAVAVTSTQREASGLKARLLNQYKREHSVLPPENRRH